MKKFWIAALCLAGAFQMSAQEPLKDWANFERYAGANEKINTPVKVVFMGNSITDNWAKMDPDFFTKNNYVGRGISGQVSAQMLIRFSPDVIALEPQAVAILAGTNDIAHNEYAVSLEKTYNNIISMVQLAEANHIVPILCSTMPAYEFGWRPGIKPAEEIIALNSKLKMYAHAHRIIYVDYHAAMQDERGGLPAKYSEDGVHPNLDGYKVMEKLVQEAIQKALNQ